MRGDFKKAIKLYEQLLQSHPDDENVKAALVWSWRQWTYKNPGDADIVLDFGQELQRMKESGPALYEYFGARYSFPQSAAHADELIAGCYKDLAADQQRIQSPRRPCRLAGQNAECPCSSNQCSHLHLGLFSREKNRGDSDGEHT